MRCGVFERGGVGVDAHHPTAEALEKCRGKADGRAEAAVDKQRVRPHGRGVDPPAAVLGAEPLESRRQPPLAPPPPQAALEPPPVQRKQGARFRLRGPHGAHGLRRGKRYQCALSPESGTTRNMTPVIDSYTCATRNGSDWLSSIFTLSRPDMRSEATQRLTTSVSLPRSQRASPALMLKRRVSGFEPSAATLTSTASSAANARPTLLAFSHGLSAPKSSRVSEGRAVWPNASPRSA